VLTDILTMALAPGARLPRLQVTVLAEGIQVGDDGAALRKVVPSGIKSVNTMSCAIDGPVFVTKIV